MADDDHGSTAPLAPPATALIRRFRLEVVDGEDRGLIYVSTRERIVIGTKSAAEVVLRDPAVSRFHCALTLHGNRVELEDLDSRNGTRVDGVAVGLAWLDRDAKLVVGSTQLHFQLVDDLVEVELSAREQFGELVGRSRAMRAVFAMCERAAASDATVLLQGETGTGKDATALSIHLEGARSTGPFVVLDCGSLAPGVVESALFGHERGAFTGAIAMRPGVFEMAAGGTLFLDEIGELPLEIQPKLLRALEARTVRRVGGDTDIPCDVRVIAATNRDLQREVNAGRFRPDLYFRLAVVEIRLPPLRHHAQDIPLVVDHLLRAMNARGPTALGLRTPASLDQLARHPWPGNVRELRNHLERSLATEDVAPPELASVPVEAPVIDTSEPLRTARERWLRYFEQRYLDALLHEHGGNVSKAARAAGVARVYFYRLLSKAGIAPQSR
jgi:DNA-binding NtrC family response regulator